MTFETIVTDIKDNIGVITFNRPEVRNALSREMVNDIHKALETFSMNDELKALILTGAGGKSFISGADISELRTRVCLLYTSDAADE